MTMTAPNGSNGQSASVVKGPAGRLANIKALFDKSKSSIAMVLPKHLTVDRLIRIATSAASRTPDLLLCTPESLLLSLVQCGIIGLEPNTPLHHAALVPFDNNKTGKKEATLIIEYRGLCQLAYQSGEVTVIYAEPIYEKDEYEIELGTAKRLVHRPSFDADREDGAIVGFYAVAKFKNGADDFAWMSKSQVDKIRAGSAGKNGDGWTKNYAEMGKKTAVRRLSKMMPMNTDKATPFLRAVSHDGKQADGEVGDYSDVIDVIGESEAADAQPAATRTDAIADRVAAKAEGKAS